MNIEFNKFNEEVIPAQMHENNKFNERRKEQGTTKANQ